MLLKVCVGSIKGSLFVFDYSPKEKTFTPSFSVQNHIGPITSIKCDNLGYLSSAGEDESAKVYKLRKNQEVGSVFAVKGGAKGLTMTKDFILLAGEDGIVNIVGKNDLKLYHSIKVNTFYENILENNL
jgi:WD40 repeat protein